MANEPLTVVPFKTVSDDAVEVARDLLVKCEAGEIVSFAAVGIEKNNATVMWMAGDRKSRLEVLGAITNLLLHFWNDDIR